MKERICIWSPKVPPTICGVAFQSATLLNELISRGHEGHMLAEKGEAHYIENSKIQVHPVMSGWSILHIPRIVLEMHRIRPDRILVQWVPYRYARKGVNFGVPWAALILRVMGFRIQLMQQEKRITERGFLRQTLGLMQTFSVLILLLAANQSHIFCETWIREARRRFRYKTESFKYLAGPSSNAFYPLSSEKRKTLLDSLPPNVNRKKIVATLSPVSSGRSLDFVEKMWSEVLRNHPDAGLLILGRLPSMLQERLSKLPNVLLPGYVNDEELSGWLQVTSLYFVHFQEGLCGKRTSAMLGLSHGLAVVTNRGHDYDKFFFDRSPFRVTDFTPEKYADTLSKLLDRPEEIERLGQESLRFYESHLSVKHFADHILDGTSLAA